MPDSVSDAAPALAAAMAPTTPEGSAARRFCRRRARVAGVRAEATAIGSDALRRSRPGGRAFMARRWREAGSSPQEADDPPRRRLTLVGDQGTCRSAWQPGIAWPWVR